ncbi:AAA family ATPase [Candidatus Woesearchaeota archaeon]|nr:AAA family ATPase [Candidatus Woesearchaeota archaeon]
MIPTGSKDLDNFLEDCEKNKINLIYGPAASGKTTICLLATITKARENKKIIFIDTENSFSIERFQQLTNNQNELLQNILILKIKNFNYQHKNIQQLEQIKNISLIVIDSFTNFYRRLVRSQPELAKAMLTKQLKILKSISDKNIPILLTSQVYSDMKNNFLPLAHQILVRYCETIVKLEKDPKRKIKVIKPNKKEKYFEITNEGIKI